MTRDEDNVATFLEFGEAFNAGGFEAIMPFLHPQIEFHEPPEQPGAAVFQGYQAAREGFAKWSSAWLEQRSEAEGFEVLPDGRILVFTREHLLGRDGVRVQNDCGSIFTSRDGKVLRWQVFWDPSDASAAVRPDRGQARLRQ